MSQLLLIVILQYSSIVLTSVTLLRFHWPHSSGSTLLSNTRPHQLCVGDWEMGTAISCKKGTQVAGLAHNIFGGQQHFKTSVLE